MKTFLLIVLNIAVCALYAQEKMNPIIKNYGGIYNIPDATVKGESDIEYNIVVDVATGAEDNSEVAWGLNNVARMINLHAISNVESKNLDVVLAIHGSATVALLDNKAFNERFGIDNPNIPLLKELHEAGVKLTVCGQSLLARKVDPSEIIKEVELATSMLTTVTTYQLKGYAALKF